MRQLSTFVFAALALAASVACSTAPTAPVDASFTLAPGHTRSVGSLTVRFIGVTIDTRCPINALCIQVGDAHVALEASTAGTRRSFELQVLNPMNRETEISGYSIAVEELAPHPWLPTPIEPSAYRVKLRVRR